MESFVHAMVQPRTPFQVPQTVPGSMAAHSASIVHAILCTFGDELFDWQTLIEALTPWHFASAPQAFALALQVREHVPLPLAVAPLKHAPPAPQSDEDSQEEPELDGP